MSIRIASCLMAAGLTALFAPACTIVTGSSQPDAGTTLDSAGGPMPDAGSMDGSQSTEASSSDAGMPGQGDGAVIGNGCADPPMNNQTRDTAAAFTLGTSVRGCLRSGTDMNFFQYTIPASPPKGGYVVLSVTNVDVAGNIDLTSQAAADNGNVVHGYTVNNGASVFQYFTAAAGATFRVSVKNFSVSQTTQTAYTLTVTYVGDPDQGPLSTTRATATTIMPNTVVNGYFLGVHTTSMVPTTVDWSNWYKVTLAAGTATVQLTNIPADIAAKATLFDSTGGQIASHYVTTSGADLTFDQATATAGDFFVQVVPFSDPDGTGTTQILPQWLTQPYSLKVFNK